ncbi:alpha/beta hydrolase [Pelagibius sp. Alg239-R121]|uniref:alpha/beta hydrolase n=1 Tax=Pelagibius sp. Alg239-R121 TaxID=2993448 RepID=UPI0024A673BA|nr:alpha/beta hydrolase [Pelagibius sp. Alg239-R121]
MVALHMTACQVVPTNVQDDVRGVRVFFATDRTMQANVHPGERFGTDRSDVKYGTCFVSIPRRHKIGALESPSLLRFEFNEDPTQHVVLVNAVVRSKDAFFSELSNHVRNSSTKQAFVFIHGYNVSFEDAARRTAQMSYDLGFDGAPVFYSWPSQATVKGYTIDESNIAWSETNLKGFFTDVLARSDAQRVHIVAHSMGSRAVTRAVASLITESPDAKARIGELILTAPDIDADIFKRDIAPVFAEAQQSTTLYSSSEDIALIASQEINGYPRAGDAGDGLVVVPGVETIDATNVDTSFYGHSYFAETHSVLSDIAQLIQTGEGAAQRPGLLSLRSPNGIYWAFE